MVLCCSVVTVNGIVLLGCHGLWYCAARLSRCAASTTVYRQEITDHRNRDSWQTDGDLSTAATAVLEK